MLDIHTVGAGGGSLVRFDAAGALRVGPESAGADPGPICYGRGTQPTVTDANLLLGRLQTDRFLGGEFTLDLERTRRITSEWLKQQPVRLSLSQFAGGVIRVVNATMEKALRVVSIERGRDPRDFALVAFGGAGGLHACELAQALGTPRVIVPALPGALSAFGILSSDVVKDYSRTVLWRIDHAIPKKKLELEFERLRRAAENDFRLEGWTGRWSSQRSIDIRYRGQGYELNVPYSAGAVSAFQTEHQRRYGYTYENRGLELVTLRLRAVLKSKTAVAPGSGPLVRQGVGFSAPPRNGPARSRRDTPRLFDRNSLHPGRRYSGAAVITEYSATTFVPKGMRFWLDRFGNLIVNAVLQRSSRY